MILRTVQLTSLVGTLAATIILPLACSSEFEGCKASRTCQPESQGGEGGENGDTAGTSGSGGNANGGAAPGGSSGAAGMAGAGDGGTGGNGDDTERPTVVSITPEDGDVDIERDVTITVELNEPIDERTATNTSVTLTGPNGEVSGTVSVDGNVVAFAPERALNLLGTYTFAFDDTIADLAGNTLAESASAEFRVRDGRLSEPVFPFGTVPREVRAFGRNALGDVVIGMNAPNSGASVAGAVYRAADDEWSSAEEVRAMASTQLYAQGAAIDPLGRAVISWASFGGAGYGWSRLSEPNVWLDAGTVPGAAGVAVSSEGMAIASWWDATYTFKTRTLDLSDGTLGSDESSTLDEDSDGTTIVASLDRLALFTKGIGGGVSDLTVEWKVETGWSSREPLATGSLYDFSVDSDAQGNIIVVWATSAGEIWSRVYVRAEDEWLPAAFLAAVSPDPSIGNISFVEGNALVSYGSRDPQPGTWAAVYQRGVGWVARSIVKLDSVSPVSPWVAGTAMDGAGNGLVAWSAAGKVRRYVATDGWQTPSFLGTTVHGPFVWAAGAPDGSALVISSEADGSTVGAPFAMRFE